jgi:glycosyltransferase involved in cell wall biosynthesis
VIAVSEQTKQELTSVYQLADDRVAVIHSGIDRLYFEPVSASRREAVRRKYDLPERYCLFVGALEPRKNMRNMLAGYRLARQSGLACELVLAGKAAGSVGSSLRSPGVRQLGYVPETDKPALYAGAMVNLLVSFHEGFGFTPLEALACGTPSIVSDLPIFTETVAEAALAVDPHKPAELAAKLVQLEQDPAIRERLLAKGKDIPERFTWQLAARRTYEVLERTATQHA